MCFSSIFYYTQIYSSRNFPVNLFIMIVYFLSFEIHPSQYN